MDLETIGTLYRYNAWANHRLLDAVAPLPPDAFVHDLGNGSGSVRDTLTHIVWSEWIWLQRWNGVTQLVFQPADFALAPAGLVFSPADFPNVDSLRERSKAVEEGIAEFLRRLDPGRLEVVSEYKLVTGETWRCPLWRQLYHGVNHSSYHRGQVAMMLRQLSYLPASTDFVSYRE
jgi:uncharacterized damage-inducible protein DinB